MWSQGSGGAGAGSGWRQSRSQAPTQPRGSTDPLPPRIQCPKARRVCHRVPIANTSTPCALTTSCIPTFPVFNVFFVFCFIMMFSLLVNPLNVKYILKIPSRILTVCSITSRLTPMLVGTDSPLFFHRGERVTYPNLKGTISLVYSVNWTKVPEKQSEIPERSPKNPQPKRLLYRSHIRFRRRGNIRNLGEASNILTSKLNPYHAWCRGNPAKSPKKTLSEGDGLKGLKPGMSSFEICWRQST